MRYVVLALGKRDRWYITWQGNKWMDADAALIYAINRGLEAKLLDISKQEFCTSFSPENRIAKE